MRYFVIIKTTSSYLEILVPRAVDLVFPLWYLNRHKQEHALRLATV